MTQLILLFCTISLCFFSDKNGKNRKNRDDTEEKCGTEGKLREIEDSYVKEKAKADHFYASSSADPKDKEPSASFDSENNGQLESIRDAEDAKRNKGEMSYLPVL